MIEVKNVTKTFDGFKALNDLTLTVPTGAIYGLVGPNGAGKSTIIRHVTGILRQDSGEILIDGNPVYENPAVKSNIAYIPDDVFFFTQATIGDMMKFYRGVFPNFSTERYEKLRKAFDLNEKAKMRSLSKGMQKQAAFWLTVCMCPKVLVLDEPVDGLDPVMRRQVWSILMSDVAENGTTVLVSSHNLRELEDVCDHVGYCLKTDGMGNGTLRFRWTSCFSLLQ
jgi:ABC-2 type transport system ATP-binding protein